MFKRKFSLFLLCSLFLASAFFFFTMFIVSGTEGISIANLTLGKNTFTFENYSDVVYASQLIRLNPSIEVISYYDSIRGKDIGYVNAFGGVGSNFMIIQGKPYEIFTNQETSLLVP